MKKSIPNYKKLQEKGVADTLYSQLPLKEQKVVDEYVKYLEATSTGGTLSNKKRNLLHFRDIIETDFDKVDLKIAQHYLSVLNQAPYTQLTKNELKTQVKRFLRWRFKDWSKRFNELRDFKRYKSLICSPRITTETLVTEDELKLIMHAATSYRDKALFSLSFESGARPQEIRLLKWASIKIDDDGFAKIQLYSTKTKQSRTILIKNCVIELQDYKQHYQYPNVREDDYVFPHDKTRDSPLFAANFSQIFKNLGKKAGIQKPIFPYLNRHTRLTTLYQKLPEQLVKKYAGHSPSSLMTQIYSHLDDKQLTDGMLEKVYNKKRITEEQKNKYEIDIGQMRNEIEQLKSYWDKMFQNIKEGDVGFTYPDMSPIRVKQIPNQ